MKYYSGTEKPYIFVDFPASYTEEAEKILEKISEKKILFSRTETGAITKKEEERIRKAYAVLLFADREFMETESFRKIVDTAVESGRSILVVYLDGAAPSDNWSHMQLDPAQALWRERFENEEQFLKKLLEAEIFRNLRYSPKQQTVRKKRLGWLRLLLFAALLAFTVLVLWPKALAPGIENAKKAAEAKEAAAKNGSEKLFSAEQLKSIQRLAVYGDRIPEPDTDHSYIDHNREAGTYTLVEVSHNGNEKRIRIAPGSGRIRDLSDIGNFTELRDLTLCLQPVKDILPVFSLENLESLSLQYCPVTDLSGIENCKNLRRLELRGIKQKEIPYFGEREEFSVNISDPYYPVTDLDFCRDVHSFEEFYMERVSAELVQDALSGKNVQRLGICESDLICPADLKGIQGVKQLDICGCRRFCTLRGIEQWQELEYIHLAWCGSLVNLKPLLTLPSLSVLEVSEDIYDMAKEQLSGAKFTVIREGEMP